MFHFVIEFDAENFSTIGFDFICGLVIEAVKVGIVDSLLRFLQIVVCGLAGGYDFPAREKCVTFFRESHNGDGIVFGIGNTGMPDKGLDGAKIFNVVTAMRELRRRCKRIALSLSWRQRGICRFRKACESLRISERVGLVPVYIFRADTLNENGLNAIFARQWRAVFVRAFSPLLIALVGSLFFAVNLGEPVARVPTGR